MKYLSGQEAAKRLNVHPETLRQMAETDRLPGVEITKTPGGHRRYEETGIEKLAANPHLLAKPANNLKRRSIKIISILCIILGLCLLVIAAIARNEMNDRVIANNDAMKQLQSARANYILQVDTALDLKTDSCSLQLASLKGMIATRQAFKSTTLETEELPMPLILQINQLSPDKKDRLREGQDRLLDAFRLARDSNYNIPEPIIYNNQFDDSTITYPLALGGHLLESFANIATDHQQISVEQELTYYAATEYLIGQDFLSDC